MPGEIQLATIRNVPVAKVGPARLWRGGERTFTEAELLDAVRASTDPEVGTPKVKLAHDKEYATAEPSFGSYEGLRYDADKQTIFADLKGVPLWLAKVLPTFYPRRSFEASENVETSTGAYKLAFRAIGSLGIKLPAIKGLADLAHWATAEMPDGVTLVAAEGTAAPAWADTSIEPEKHDRESQVNIREKLGLPAEATDEQVAAKLDELAAQAAAGSPEALQKVKDDALAEAKDAADKAEADRVKAEEEAAAAEAARAAATAGTTVTVEAAAFEALKADAAAGRAARDLQVKAERTALIERKVKAGAVAPASRENLLNLLEAGAMDEATIEALPDGVLPIDGTPVGDEDSGDLDAAGAAGDDTWMMGLLNDDERKALAAATKGS